MWSTLVVKNDNIWIGTYRVEIIREIDTKQMTWWVRLLHNYVAKHNSWVGIEELIIFATI